MRTLVGAHINALWTAGGPFIGAEGKPHGRVTVQDTVGDVLHVTTASPNEGPPYTDAMVRALYVRYGHITDDQIMNDIFHPPPTESAAQRIARNVLELNTGLRTWNGLETSIRELPGSVLPSSPIGGATADSPLRWFQDASNSQGEIEIPNVRQIKIDRSIDQDAATCNIDIYNQQMLATGAHAPQNELGQPGYFTAGRGASLESRSRWHQTVNDWSKRLVPNAIIRTYQGYGGTDKTIAEALADGNVVLTGIWFVDSIEVTTEAALSIKARDPMKLLLEQQLYPPLIPHGKYPLKYYRWQYYNDTLRAASRSLDGIFYEALFLGADKHKTGIGYLTSDGFDDVDAFGDAHERPKTGGSEMNAFTQATSVREARTGNGYYVLNGLGQMAVYGNAEWFGDPYTDGYVASNGVNGVAFDMAVTHTGAGYWVLDSRGHIFGYGDAIALEDLSLHDLTGATEWLSIESHPTEMGAWVLDHFGKVYAQGAVTSYGSAPSSSWTPVTTPGDNVPVCLRCTATGDGYWIMTTDAQVQAFGAAVDKGGDHDTEAISNLWSKKYWKLVPQDDGGYLLLRGDGTLIPFGTANYFGNAVPGGTSTKRAAGDYLDYSDIVKDLVLWAGFYLNGDSSNVLANPQPPYTSTVVRALFFLYGFTTDQLIEDATWLPIGETADQRVARIVNELNTGARTWANLVNSVSILPGALVNPTAKASVYGNIESTGAWSADPLPDAMFDKKPVIDPLHEIKEIVGYLMYCDDEGAFRFETPNWWGPGNFNEVGTYTAVIPEIDERKTLTDYSTSVDDAPLRSEIIISSEDPDQSTTTLTTRIRPSDAADLRGLVKPAMWVNGFFQDRDQQRIMAELIALHIHFQARLGNATCVANPLIGVGDQVRILERQTSDSYVHFVRTMSTTMDLDSGQYTMTLGTHWLGDLHEWGVIPSGSTGVSWGFRLSPNVTYWSQRLHKNPRRTV